MAIIAVRWSQPFLTIQWTGFLFFFCFVSSACVITQDFFLPLVYIGPWALSRSYSDSVSLSMR